MLNNNHKSCQFAEQTISYLYGESGASEKTEFESHLKTCPTCADELDSFGFIRSAVLDWRNEDFAKLQTPAFDIPATKSENVFSPATNSTESRSWFGGLGKIFSFNPALAAFAVLVVCVGAALFAFKFSGGDGGEIAGNKNNANLAQAAAASPIIEATKKPEVIIIGDEDSRKSLPTVVKTDDSSRRAARERQIVPVKSAVKVSDGSSKIDTGSSARSTKNANDNIKKIAPVKNQQVPNLNVADDEDETIRLADLFDEIDAR
jgi:anti-sigma factor RsiW